jgi:hypothetical protein
VTPEARAGLQALARALPTGSAVSVPREWLLELLDGTKGPAAVPSALSAADLTVLDLATRFGRRTSTVRGWLERGLFPGAYKFMGGREWRVPRAALDAFEERERKGETDNSGVCGPHARLQRAADLGAWRKAS